MVQGTDFEKALSNSLKTPFRATMRSLVADNRFAYGSKLVFSAA
ncbi:MAG: hypothetical protein ACFFGZ_10705 [Candidatus Thorarchaeota archaeon]